MHISYQLKSVSKENENRNYCKKISCRSIRMQIDLFKVELNDKIFLVVLGFPLNNSNLQSQIEPPFHSSSPMMLSNSENSVNCRKVFSRCKMSMKRRPKKKLNLLPHFHESDDLPVEPSARAENQVLFQFMEFFNEQLNLGRSIWALVLRKRDSVPRRQIPTEDGNLYICDYFSPYVCIGKQYYPGPGSSQSTFL